MSHDPTPSQALLIFGLLARHGDCAQAELMPAVKKADREALVKAKLVSAGKVGRGLQLTLEDAGWAWAAAHLSAELPPAQRALSDMLARLDAHLAKHDETLADFIGSKPVETVSSQTIKVPAKKKSANSPTTTRKVAKTASSSRESSTKPKSSPTKKKSSSTKRKTAPRKTSQKASPTPAALRKQIEKAYLQITAGRKNESVRLSHLRAALPDLDRATLDAALARILSGDKTASLMRHDDPRQIGDADREAAFNPSGEPFHVIWIAS